MSILAPGTLDSQRATFYLAAPSRFVSTDYVVDETLTLLKARGRPDRAFRLGQRLFSGQLARLIYVSSDDVAAAWHIFSTHRDKAWSFTDCTSYTVMKRLNLVQAFAFDEHFRQFGFANVLP